MYSGEEIKSLMSKYGMVYLEEDIKEDIEDIKEFLIKSKYSDVSESKNVANRVYLIHPNYFTSKFRVVHYLCSFARI